MAEKTDKKQVSRAVLFGSFLRLGTTAFGGPAMVAYIRRLAVERRRWLPESEFRRGVALVQSIPGATAMQMAGYVGLKTCGITGALCSFTGFALPAFALMVALSAVYATAHDTPDMLALFSGLQVIVVAIVANAAVSFGRDILKGIGDVALAVAAAVLLGVGVSPFLVIAGAAVLGMLIFWSRAGGRVGGGSSGEDGGGRADGRAAADLTAPDGDFQAPAVRPAGYVLAVTAAAGAMAFLFILDRGMFDMAALLMRIDIFAFGGGFTALPLMLHEIVDVRQWLDSGTFMDGVALGQVTPGPIIITSAFVGYQLFGLPGAAVAAAAMFTPSFLVMVGVSPFFDRLSGSRWFGRAIRGVLATFVGLLVFVMVKFAREVPWDVARVLLGAAALVALLRKVDILYVVLVGAAVSVVVFR